MEEGYDDEVKAPVLVVATKQLKSFTGMHCIRGGFRNLMYKRPPRGADPEFVDAVMSEGGLKFYHEVKLSGRWLTHLRTDSVGSLDYWGLRELYPSWVLSDLKYATAVCIIHLLAHEMQHAVQTDGYRVGDRKAPYKLTMCKDWWREKHRLPTNYFHTNKEADAEIGAQEMGPILFERYAELAGWQKGE
ncbi:MAG: hypothetical protein CMB80_02120 [Flammeovirgaceae bacterium]|nr:hypothetical protein [Flammeovirgaceae bacterium]